MLRRGQYPAIPGCNVSNLIFSSATVYDTLRSKGRIIDCCRLAHMDVSSKKCSTTSIVSLVQRRHPAYGRRRTKAGDIGEDQAAINNLMPFVAQVADDSNVQADARWNRCPGPSRHGCAAGHVRALEVQNSALSSQPGVLAADSVLELAHAFSEPAENSRSSLI